jgi:hypothetical protein
MASMSSRLNRERSTGVTNEQDQRKQGQGQGQGQGEGKQSQQDTGGLERSEVGNQVWETDAGREQPGLGERIAEGEVAPPRRAAPISAYPDRESGKGLNEDGRGAGTPDEQLHDEAEQTHEPAGQRGENSPPAQELGNPGTTGNDLDIVGGQPI